MTEALLAALYIFVIAMFLGFAVITKVPPLLHTPLMSGSNAISGITIIGALIVAGRQEGLAADGLGTDRDHLRDDQRRRRVLGHRPHAPDVQEKAG
jgi:hypothetical protein